MLMLFQALMQEKNLLFTMQKPSSKILPWNRLKKRETYNQAVKNTLFCLQFLSVTVDEAHEFRNMGPKLLGVLEILKLGTVRMILTATPLQTSTKVGSKNPQDSSRLSFLQDLANMARMVGIDYFTTQEALDEEKADVAEVRRAKVALGEEYDPLDVREDSDDPIREVQDSIARRIQAQFEGRVLRRTIDSKNWLGESLISLPMLHEHMVLLSLQPFEREIHSQIGRRLQEE